MSDKKIRKETSRQLIFIDDSGDPGFRVGKGSSKSLVIAMAIFDDPLDAEETALNIKKLRKTVGKDENFEFRFHNLRRPYREQFLHHIKNDNFRIRAIVMPKGNIYSPHLIGSKDSFLNFTIKTALKYHSGTIADAKVFFDSSGDRTLRNKLAVYLRKELNNKENKIIKDFKFKDSKRNLLIQLADMCAGSIRKYHDEKDDTDKDIYLKIIRKRLEDIWVFGK